MAAHIPPIVCSCHNSTNFFVTEGTLDTNLGKSENDVGKPFVNMDD